VNRRLAASLPGLCLLLALAGCAAPGRMPEETASAAARWSGRMSVRVEASPSLGPQAFSSTFELQGGPSQGDLYFYTPLGSTAASIVWTPGQAQLQSGAETPTLRQHRRLDRTRARHAGAGDRAVCLAGRRPGEPGWLGSRPVPIWQWQNYRPTHQPPARRRNSYCP